MKRLVRQLVGALVSIIVLLLVWQILVKGFHLDPYITRGPLDVLGFLTNPAKHPDHQTLLHATGETLRDAALGLVAGIAAGLLVAVVFALWRPVQAGLLPIAMALRAVPLVAMAPLITIIFGRDLLGVTVIAGIVTFFPVLVNVSLALRSIPASSVDLIHAYGGHRFALMWRVQLPASLPALFAAARVAAPLSLVGALLAEWIATGRGLGYLLLTSLYSYKIDLMWSAVAISTIASIVLYAIVSFLEALTLSRFAYPTGSR